MNVLKTLDTRIKYIPLHFTVAEFIWFVMFFTILFVIDYYNLFSFIIYIVGCFFLGKRDNFGGKLKEVRTDE